MTRRRAELNSWISLGSVASATFGVFALGGCQEEAPPPPPPPPARVDRTPEAPVAAKRLNPDSLLETLEADPKLSFAQVAAPYDYTLGEAIVNFATAIVQGDELAMGDLLDPTGQAVLDDLAATGEIFDVADTSESIRVVYLDQTPDASSTANSARFVFAIKDPDGAYVVGWDGVKNGENWTFAAFEVTKDYRSSTEAWDSDSSTDFRPAAGAQASRGGFAPPPGVNPVAELEKNPGIAYFAIEMTAELVNIVGAPLDKAQIISLTATQLGIEESRLQELIDEGSEVIANGDHPDPAVIGGFVLAGRLMAAESGATIEDNQIVEAIAKVLGISQNEALEYFEQAKP
ncbi:MAG: hypothetical protein AAGI53_05315 [Planctomycetota bacterium]